MIGPKDDQLAAMRPHAVDEFVEMIAGDALVDGIITDRRIFLNQELSDGGLVFVEVFALITGATGFCFSATTA